MSLSEFTRQRPMIVSRRSALAATGVAAFGLTRLRSAAAQGTDLASHPLTGTWLAMANPVLPDAPQFPAPSLFAADGTVLLVFPQVRTDRRDPSSMLPRWGCGSR